MAWLTGARFAWVGVLVTVVAAILLTVIFAALSNAVALLVRQQEALIGISQFTALPLTFLSSAVMDPGPGAGSGSRTSRGSTRSTGPSWRRRETLLGYAGLVGRCGRGSGRSSWWRA